MPIYSAAPHFRLGEVISGTDENGNLKHDNLLGKKYTLNQYESQSGSRLMNVELPTEYIAVLCRNTSGGVLLGKRLGLFERTDGQRLAKNCDGYTNTQAELLYGIIDPFLPDSGVPDDDIFWMVLEGDSLELLTPNAGSGFNGDIAIGDPLYAATGADSATTLAGRVARAGLANDTDAAGALKHANGLLGYAAQARTTANTNTTILVNARIKV